MCWRGERIAAGRRVDRFFFLTFSFQPLIIKPTPGTSLRLRLASRLAAALARAARLEAALECDAKLVLGRFAASAADSAMLTVQGILYYASLHTLSFFGLEKAVFAFKSDLERAVCAASGTWHVCGDGTKHHYSLLSSMDADFSTPGYSPAADFPTACVPTPDTAINAHFAALACKAVYERDEIVADIVQRVWGLRLVAHGRVPAHWTDDHWVPDLVWFAAETERGVVLALKGADPLWQVNLRADPPTSKARRDGVAGAVHCGLWRGLHQAAPGAPAGTTVMDTLVAALRSTPAEKPIILTGHSLGGGLAALLAAALHARQRDVADRVAGVFTFAAPRYGDGEFADAFNAAFAGRAFRYVHASDMVCKLPPQGCGYGAAATQRFITSFAVDGGSRSLPFGRGTNNAARTTSRSASGRILREEDDPDRVRFWTAWEDRGAWLFSAAKLARAAARGDEPRVRTVLRAALFAVPGFSDHFLCDYERALRQELTMQQAQAAAAAAAVATGAAAPAPLPATASPFATVQVVSRSTTKAGRPPSGRRVAATLAARRKA